MREHGVKVLTVRDILSYGVEDHVGARVELEDLAMKVRLQGMTKPTYCGKQHKQEHTGRGPRTFTVPTLQP